MTVIATDGRTMAADTLITCKGQLLARKQKVRRLNDGRIVGAAGSTAECQMLVRWLNDGGEKPDLSDDVAAIILNPDGSVDWIDFKFELVKGYELPTAIGCGDDMPVGAMLAGATPQEAVMLVSTRQLNIGGEITVLHRTEQIKAVA